MLNGWLLRSWFEIASNFWSKPEIQFFVTYLHGNENGLEFSEYGSSAYQVHVDSEKGPVIHEGTRVDILDDSMKDWKYIRLGDNREGWLHVSQIEKI